MHEEEKKNFGDERWDDSLKEGKEALEIGKNK